MGRLTNEKDGKEEQGWEMLITLGHMFVLCIY